MYLICYIALRALRRIPLAIVNPRFDDPLIVECGETSCLVKYLVNELICAVGFHLEIYNWINLKSAVLY